MLKISQSWEVGGDKEGGRGKDCQRTCIKDTWTKPKGGRIDSGRWVWLGWVGVVGRKWRQLYLPTIKTKGNRKENKNAFSVKKKKKN